MDLSALAHILAEGRTATDEPARTVVASGRIADLDADLPGGGHGHIGAITLRDAGGRALAVPMSSLVDLAPKADAAPPTPERRRALSGLMADLAMSQSLAQATMTDIAIEAAPASQTRVSAATFTLSGVAGGRIARAALDALSVAVGQTPPTTIGHLALAGLDLRPLLAAGVEDDATARATVPFDRIELDALSAAVPATGTRIPLALGHIALDAKDWRGTAPQTFGLAIDHLAFDLPTDDPRARPLLDLGYKRFDLSATANVAYDAGKRELGLDRVGISAPDVGAIQIASTFSDVSPDVMTVDVTKARAALTSSLFRRAALTVTDTGLLSRMIAAQATQDKTSPADIRARWATGLRAAATDLLVNNADRGAIADAVEHFVRTGGRLALSAEAPDGLGLIDAMLAGSLQGVLGKVKLRATD